MIKRYSWPIFIILIIAASVGYLWTRKSDQPVANQPLNSEVQPTENTTPEVKNTIPVSPFVSPLDRSKERVTKKSFGILIDPKNSPVQPERFQGYHTGTDFEIFPEEADAEVPVKAVCDGRLILKKYAEGYGGVAVERCELDGEPITVVYGHLRLTSISYAADDSIKAGETLGILGKGYSQETDGERKHLHLSLHKGSAIALAGYVNQKSALEAWLDPCHYVCI